VVAGHDPLIDAYVGAGVGADQDVAVPGPGATADIDLITLSGWVERGAAVRGDVLRSGGCCYGRQLNGQDGYGLLTQFAMNEVYSVPVFFG